MIQAFSINTVTKPIMRVTLVVRYGTTFAPANLSIFDDQHPKSCERLHLYEVESTSQGDTLISQSMPFWHRVGKFGAINTVGGTATSSGNSVSQPNSVSFGAGDTGTNRNTRVRGRDAGGGTS